MRDRLDADPESILDEVLFAKEMTGESVDPDDLAARRSTLAEIRAAQAGIAREAQAGPDGRLLVHRAVALRPDALAALAPGDALGGCWAFDPGGAHAYDGRAGVPRYVLSAWVSPGDVAWAETIAMWSGGEGEARLDRRAQVELAGIREQAGGLPVREDLAGETFSACEAQRASAKPR